VIGRVSLIVDNESKIGTIEGYQEATMTMMMTTITRMTAMMAIIVFLFFHHILFFTFLEVSLKSKL